MQVIILHDPIEISPIEFGSIEISCNNIQAQLYSFPLFQPARQPAFMGLSAQAGGNLVISPAPYSVILSCLPSGNGQVDKIRPYRALRLQSP